MVLEAGTTVSKECSEDCAVEETHLDPMKSHSGVCLVVKAVFADA